jgi:subtilase family serine protease
MRSPRSIIAATALAATTITVAAAGSAAHANTSSVPASRAVTTSVRLPGSVAPFAAAGRAIGTAPATTKLTIQFWLAQRSAAAAGYAAAVSTPGSRLFRHFLSPAGYVARFGATPAAAAAVESWLRSTGFTGIGTDLGRDYVQATAPVATIEAALRVRINYYRTTDLGGTGRYPLRGNDRPVALPASIAGRVLGVTGLDNAAPAMTYVRDGVPARTGTKAAGTKAAGTKAAGTKAAGSPAFACSHWYLQHFATGLPEMFGATKFPSVLCGYTPQQLRRAYNLSLDNTGKGVSVALVEVGLTPDMFQTLAEYAKVHDIQAPSTTRYFELSLGRGAQCGDPFNVEEQLDVEASYSMAPASNQIVVGGDSCDDGFFGLQALFDADLAVLNGIGNRPLAQVASNSWEAGAEGTPAGMLQITHAYLIRAADEGVSMLFSAGDSSGVEVPSSDPYATAVGGTTLAVGHDGPQLFETGWSTGISTVSGAKWLPQGEDGASGGGASLLWQQPGYQRGVVPAPLARATGDRGGLVRAVPDISADADGFTGMTVGMLSFDDQGNVTGYFEQSIAGTSLATLLVAGVVADAEQGQPRSFGFLNPALYKLAGTKAFDDVLPLSATANPAYRGVACDANTCGLVLLTTFDDQSSSMAGYTGQVTAPGYDSMTGIGTPSGQSFISALRYLPAAAAP